MAVPRTPHAIAYLRVSTDRQADSGLGLEAQHASIAACAARLGVRLAEVFSDAGTSGSLTIEDRPVLLDAVASLKRGDVLIVAKRDRLGRDVIAVAMIERLVATRGQDRVRGRRGFCLPRTRFFLRTLILWSSADRVLVDAIRTLFVAADPTHITPHSLDSAA
jgi:DNA invertase Pin-like site-specific DNA recombinase